MMNRRMREPFHTLMWKASIGYNDSWSQVDPEVLEKFAESIVRECSKVIVNGGYRNPAFGEKYPLAPPEIAKMIEEHFGVEQ